MTKKENVIIYPYDSQFTPIMRSESFRNSYNIVGLSSLPGWGLCGKDAGYADGGCNLNIFVDNRFEEYLDICDTVIFVEPDNYIECERSILPKMFKAIDAEKNIISLIQLNENLLDKIEKYCNKKKVYFKNYRKNSSSPKFENLFLNSKRENDILYINIPIISVVGVSENTHKFSLQLEIKSNLEEKGYKVSHVGSRGYCEFIGSHSFPNFMLDNGISEVDKIYLFNRFIKKIEIEEKPDVIIIGIPGGLIPHNNQVNNNFGITPYEVFHSVISEASIVSLFHENYTPEFFNAFSTMIEYRFGFKIDAFNVANRQIDWVEMVNAKPDKIRFVTLNPDIMDKRISECRTITNTPIYNILNSDDSYKMTQMLVDKLTEKESAVVF